MSLVSVRLGAPTHFGITLKLEISPWRGIRSKICSLRHTASTHRYAFFQHPAAHHAPVPYVGKIEDRRRQAPACAVCSCLSYCGSVASARRH